MIKSLISWLYNFTINKENQRQICRFLVIGAISTCVSYLVFILLFRVFDVHYILSSALGFFAGILFGYPANRRWTFGVSKSEKKAASVYKYFSTYIFSLFVGMILLRITVEWFLVMPELANVLVICVTTLMNFLGTKLWVFKK
jgi:putative flippase GtrA